MCSRKGGEQEEEKQEGRGRGGGRGTHSVETCPSHRHWPSPGLSHRTYSLGTVWTLGAILLEEEAAELRLQESWDELAGFRLREEAVSCRFRWPDLVAWSVDRRPLSPRNGRWSLGTPSAAVQLQG